MSTAALDGFQPEGKVSIRYAALSGRYPDGRLWQLRAPRYVLTELTRGPLSPRTVVQPRLAPALFGVGLLEAVEGETAARFGWQGTSITVRDQTTKAFARDMGLTTSDRPVDDCTAAEPECRAAPDGGIPEVADDLLEAVVEFQRTLAVPESVLPSDRETAESGARPEPDGRAKRAAPAGGLFAAAGCAALSPPHPAAAAGNDRALHGLAPAMTWARPWPTATRGDTAYPPVGARLPSGEWPIGCATNQCPRFCTTDALDRSRRPFFGTMAKPKQRSCFSLA